MKISKPLQIVLFFAAIVGAIYFFKSRSQPDTDSTPTQSSLPINTIPVADRPFVTLTPDASGRNLTLGLDNTTVKEKVEYELVYNAIDKQEGAFGRINLATESLPVAKKLLLGSKSGGGKITYHEGITGGSLTLTYGDTRLKESFSFLRFDPTDPVVSSQDSRFTATFGKKALGKDAVIVVMKSFGLPEGELNAKEILAGPYALLTAKDPGDLDLEIKLPQGEYTEEFYAYQDGEWVLVPSETSDGVLTAEGVEGSVFVVIDPQTD